TCAGLIEAAAFSRIQLSLRAIVQNITRISAKTSWLACSYDTECAKQVQLHVTHVTKNDQRSGRRRQNANRSLPNSEINRATPREFAIELKGNVLFARYAQLPRLKIFDFRSLNVGAEYNVLEILDDFEIAEALEDDDVKQSIIDDGVFKKREGTAVKAPVANKNEQTLFHCSMYTLDEELRRLPRRDVRCGDKIAERTETAFESEAGLFDHLCVQPHAPKLDKIFPIRARQIDQTDVSVFDDVPAAPEIVQWQAELHRENVYSAHWDHAQCGIAADKSVCYLANCSVAACRDDPR